ncbi:MAG: TIGR03960 family B12-binding radical SAM protein, partial [Acidobacteriota bacterium]
GLYPDRRRMEGGGSCPFAWQLVESQAMINARMERILNGDLLESVERPGRYLGGEVNSVNKDLAKVDFRICLAFPDLYDLGLANVGLLILYSLLNRQAGVWAERTYAPALDMEERMRARSIPLWSWESKTPLGEFDAIGFTLQYELCFTNVLNMLELSSIPIRRDERDDRHPVILAGGPCVFNPEPIADFIDAFVIGDGEEVVVEIVRALRETRGRPREEKLRALAGIEGVYVPLLAELAELRDGSRVVLNGGLLEQNCQEDVERWLAGKASLADLPAAIRKRLILDLNQTPYVTDYIVPWVEQVHDRVSLEIFRGCMRGCRFCQAGMITRPVRERSLETIAAIVEDTRKKTGYEELTLMSLSSCDYSQAFRMVRQTVAQLAPHHVGVSMPSTRVDGFNMEIAETIAGYKRSNWTFAPEAGTQRLRDAIAKPITQEELLAKTEQVFAGGWGHIKLYFMIGLPTETEEDVIGIAELANEVLRCGRKKNPRARINLGVSTHVPKPHTPFQWSRQISIDETRALQRLLRSRIRNKTAMKFGYHDAETSFLEGVFSRGDRRVGRALQEAHRLGCRFDGWSEHFRFATWREAFERSGVDAEFYHKEIPVDRPLPWDHVDSLVTKEFHRKEWEKTLACTPIEDCRLDAHCYMCGPITRFPKGKANPCVNMIHSTRKGLENDRIALEKHRKDRPQGEQPVGPKLAPGLRPSASPLQRLRFRFAKVGPLRFLSHLELMRAFQRALRRAEIPMAFSQGFSPHPKLSFATALPVGIESEAEWADVELAKRVEPEAFLLRLNATLPDGLEALETREVPLEALSLTSQLQASTYRITNGADWDEQVTDRMEGLLRAEEVWRERKSKKGKKRVNIRPFIHSLNLEEERAGHSHPRGLLVTLADHSGGKGRPTEIAELVWGGPGHYHIRKVSSQFRN